MSPSCPYDAEMVGKANAAANVFTHSEAIPVWVTSRIKCGGFPSWRELLYCKQTEEKSKLLRMSAKNDIKNE